MRNKGRGAQSYSVTSTGVNPVEDRAHRMRMYVIAMLLRLACVVSLFWVRGWWVAIPVIGAIVLPWFAVMVGNAVEHGGNAEISQPDPLQLESAAPVREATDAAAASAAAAALLIVDVEPVRRAQHTTQPAQAPHEQEAEQ